MNINIQSVHFKASEDLQKHIHDKVRKLFEHNDKIIRADVKLFEEGNGQITQYCEIRLIIPGDDHIAKKGAVTYEKAVLDTVDTLRKMIRRAKK